MSDNAAHGRADAEESTPFDRLIADSTSPSSAPTAASFATSFRGYDKDEVDAELRSLRAKLNSAEDQVTSLKQNQRRAGAAVTHSREKIEKLEADLAAAEAQRAEAVENLEAAVAAAVEHDRDAVERLSGELAAANARAASAEHRVQALTEELVGAAEESSSSDRPRFEEILRVAEEQANVLLRNATVQGERLLEVALEDIEARRKDAQAEAEAVVSQAQHEAQQIRLKIDTELTAHQARLEREAAHAAEKVSQAEREAAAIRTESEKGAAALRSMVARETGQARAEAEEAVRELRVRALDFEASLTRRQDDAQQEFLVLHTQAVAHAERITQDANEQVAASLDHAQRVSAKAEDFERLMRAQAAQIEADANVRSRETLDQAHAKAQRIMDLVTTQAQTVLRDAEDRTRQLRWQQHQLTSFMSEVKEMIRPAGVESSRSAGAGAAADVVVAAIEDEPADSVVEDESDAEAEAAVEDEPADSVVEDESDAETEADDEIVIAELEAEDEDAADSDADDVQAEDAETERVDELEPANS